MNKYQLVRNTKIVTFSLNVENRPRSRVSRTVSPTNSIGSRGSRGSRGKGKPMIVSELHSQLQLDGTLQLDCSVLDEHSVTSVVWYKNDRRVFGAKESQSQGQFSLNISLLSSDISKWK